MKTLLVYALIVIAVTASIQCDIVIAGGTLAALGAVISSPLTTKVCLIEPTDRLGGQWGDEGVWHIDFNWLYQHGYPDNTTAYNPANLHYFFKKVVSQCSTGDCWVSRNCFLYSCLQPIIDEYLQPIIQQGNLLIFTNSMIKDVSALGSTITSIQIITRKQTKEDCRPADARIKDWYSTSESEFYSKSILDLKVNKFIIEASQYGDILVLANAGFLQGNQHSSTCGQSIVFGLHQEYSNSSKQAFSLTIHPANQDDFSLGSYTVDQVWRYRRLLGKGLNPKPSEITLQNWNGPGNDYRDGYLFNPIQSLDTKDWFGGLNFTTLRQAQARSLRFGQWFKAQAQLPLQTTGKYFNTCNGTSKLPYIRDGRRSIGYKNFLLDGSDVTGTFVPNSKLIGTPFEDRVSLGFYNMDLHSIKNCQYDPFPQSLPLPFFIPARALTNNKFSNLIVTGRALAQNFQASMATRTHTTQFSAGVASMWMASYMTWSGLASTWKLIECPQCIRELQQLIRTQMPLEWTIAGKQYPSQAVISDIE